MFQRLAQRLRAAALIMAGAVVLTAVTSCGGAASNPAAQSATVHTVQAAASAPLTAPGTRTLGSGAAAMTVTLTGVQDATTAGARVVTVSLTLRNTGRAVLRDTPRADLSVTAARGGPYSPDTARTAALGALALPAVLTLAPGASAHGTVAFTVAASASLAWLRYRCPAGSASFRLT